MSKQADKITSDMLSGLGDVVRMAFSALYPTGLTVAEIEALSHKRNWMAQVYEYLKESGMAT